MSKRNEIIDKLKIEIKKCDRPENRLNYQKFFKEKLDDPVRIKAAVLRKVSTRLYKDINERPKDEILETCDNLLKTGEKYFGFFAFDWAIKCGSRYTKSDSKMFESWLKKYVDNWGSCDHYCGIWGRLLIKYPELYSRNRKWTKSENRWERRAAAVGLIEPLRESLMLAQAFEIAGILLLDTDDMVLKGYGWMLKEAGNVYRGEVFKFVMKHKGEMPRTALRYAIEKFPADLKKQAMAKG